MQKLMRVGVVAALGLMAGTAAASDVIFETPGPGGWLGINGFDVSTQQTVAARFSVRNDANLDRAGIWLMNNDEFGQPWVTVTLRTDGVDGEGDSVPGGTILETWQIQLPMLGWNPELVMFESVARPLMTPGHYWFVAESEAAPLVNPVWCISSEGNEYTATANPFSGWQWQEGWGAAVGLRVEVTPVGGGCPADWDGSGGVDGDDIGAFFIDWQAGDADIDQSGGTDGDDITVFFEHWQAGC